MEPISNRIMILLMVSDIILIAVTAYMRSDFGVKYYLLTLFIQSLALVSTIVSIKTRINWERNRDYQKSVKI